MQLTNTLYLFGFVTTLLEDEIDEFHDRVNEQNSLIKFTKEIEEDGAIAFLDCLVSRGNYKLQTTLYRKPTHTDRLLDQSTYNPSSHKTTTIKTLTRRAQLICNTPYGLRQENDYLQRVFYKNNYNFDFINSTFTKTMNATETTVRQQLQQRYPT